VPRTVYWRKSRCDGPAARPSSAGFLAADLVPASTAGLPEQVGGGEPVHRRGVDAHRLAVIVAFLVAAGWCVCRAGSVSRRVAGDEVLEGGEGGLGGIGVAEDAESRGPGGRGEPVAQAEPLVCPDARAAGDHGVRDGRQDLRLGALLARRPAERGLRCRVASSRRGFCRTPLISVGPILGWRAVPDGEGDVVPNCR